MLLVASTAGLLLACSSEDSIAAGVNAACTRTKDCQAGLFCTGGVCTPSDGGTEGGSDATGPVDASGQQ